MKVSARSTQKAVHSAPAPYRAPHSHLETLVPAPDKGLGPTGRQRRAKRHIGSALFLAGLRRFQPVRVIIQDIEKQVILYAGDAI